MGEYALRLENGTDTAERMRHGDALGLYPGADALGARNGLRPGGGVCTVVPGTMGVQVTALTCWVDGGTSVAQGGYPYVLDATKTVTLADGHASLSRTDVIAVVVRDDVFDGGGLTEAVLEVVQGTPGAGVPALPASCVPIREVTVPAGLSAGTGGLSSSHLGTDRRQWMVGLGGILPVANIAERNALTAHAGMAVWREDIGHLQVHDGTSWVSYKRNDGLLIQHGTVTAEIVAAGGATETITFDEPFSGPPTVTVTSGNNTYFATAPTPPTATQADVRIVHRDGSSTTANVDAYWIAVGPS